MSVKRNHEMCSLRPQIMYLKSTLGSWSIDMLDKRDPSQKRTESVTMDLGCSTRARYICFVSYFGVNVFYGI